MQMLNLILFKRRLQSACKTLLIPSLCCAWVSLSTAPMPVEAATKTTKNGTLNKKASKSQTIKSKKSVRQTTLKRSKAQGFKVNSGGKIAANKTYFVPTRPSMGMLNGLHATPDPLDLRSSVAMVVDADSGAVLLEKNASTALPIASISKLMTAIVVLDAQQDLKEHIMIDDSDVNLEKYSRSRLKVGTVLTRYEILSLALMSSENRAANALSRYYPGGKPAFVNAMNAKAKQLGMTQSNFTEGTGLSSANVASAQDLVRLVQAGLQYPIIRELSTRPELTIEGGNGKPVQYRTTNRLIANPNWDIVLQKTGFISEAGQCLVMATRIDGHSIIMVFLDSQGKLSRLGDAQRVRDWIAETAPYTLPTSRTAFGLMPPTLAQNIGHTAIISPRN
jgi:serine-type D-Ala-D-Ala endopeptidase (penicillin-binding protein 7)